MSGRRAAMAEAIVQLEYLVDEAGIYDASAAIHLVHARKEWARGCYEVAERDLERARSELAAADPRRFAR